MIVRIEQDKKHYNFYEGFQVGFHPTGEKWEGGLIVIVEGKKESVTIDIEKGSNTRIFLMNDQGKTIEKIFV